MVTIDADTAIPSVRGAVHRAWSIDTSSVAAAPANEDFDPVWLVCLFAKVCCLNFCLSFFGFFSKLNICLFFRGRNTAFCHLKQMQTIILKQRIITRQIST